MKGIVRCVAALLAAAGIFLAQPTAMAQMIYSVQLTWESPGDPRVEYYAVYRAPQPTGPWERVTTRTQTSYRHVGVDPFVKHYYAVTSIGAGAESERSNVAECVFPLATPKNLKAAAVK